MTDKEKIDVEVDIKIDKNVTQRDWELPVNQPFETTANLRIRKEPNFNAQILCVVPKGAFVICQYHIDQEWDFVKYKDQFGYCAKEWLI